MDPLFLDTGYLIALEAADDQYHATAAAHWNRLRKALPPLVTTTFVIDEVVTFFSSRNRHAKAVELGHMLVESPSVELVQVDTTLFQRGWDCFQERPDKRFSLTDCISFAVMTERGIAQALSFDRHFVQAGFATLP